VRLDWYNDKAYVELNDYAFSGIWDVMDVPGNLVAESSRVEFRIVIRRKTLFYTVILIIPTVLMAFLSMMVFYLPADCSEKITLAISILLALVVFLLLVSKILPPTSDTIPLMAKYLLMTFVMNIITILMTVVIINIYFRSPTTHTMPHFVRQVFLQILPRMLMMQRPERIRLWNGFFPEEYKASELIDAGLVIPSMMATFVPFIRPRDATKQQQDRHHPNCRATKDENGVVADFYDPTLTQWLSHETSSAIDAIAYIAEHMKTDIEDKKVRAVSAVSIDSKCSLCRCATTGSTWRW
jgi:nicotinic acetylcholine receptor